MGWIHLILHTEKSKTRDTPCFRGLVHEMSAETGEERRVRLFSKRRWVGASTREVAVTVRTVHAANRRPVLDVVDP